jgi:methylmalonyl-CoA epimerase
MMLSLDHLGLATRDADALADLLAALVGGPRYDSEAVAEQGVAAHFLPAAAPGAPPPALELVEPTDPDSAVARFLEKQGPGMHHLALRVPSAEAAMRRAQEQDLRVLSEEPRPGAGRKRVAFLHPRDTGGVLVELCEHTDPLPEPERVPLAHEGAEGTLAAYPFGSTANPPLLMLHGAAGCTRLETRALAHRLAPHFRVVALDFPGHGASDRFEGVDFSPALFAEGARATLDHFGHERAAVFGFSTGGTMALALAQRYPERVTRLAVHGACIDWDEAQAEQMATRLNVDSIRAENGPATATLDGAHRDWQRLFARTERFVRALPGRTDAMRAMVEDVEAPTLVSAADRDDLFPLEAALALYRRLPRARLAVVPGESHALARADLGALVPPLARHLRANAEA